MVCAMLQTHTSDPFFMTLLPIPLLSTVIDVQRLGVSFRLDEGELKSATDVSFRLDRAKTLGVVGESGCGKTVTAMALMGLTPKPGQVTGSATLHCKDGSLVDLVALDSQGREMRSVRGKEISMIFQEPMKAFSPVHTIGDQILEGVLLHNTSDRKLAMDIVLEVLSRVHISNVKQRVHEYPHQLSGGMRQRAMIAMALACRPSILIADEPTTALDVTVQAQVLNLIQELQRDSGMALIVITHDMAVIAQVANDVVVMYLGNVVETASVETLFHAPAHPYTQALLQSIPSASLKPRTRLNVIDGTVPLPLNLPTGCGFWSRCKHAIVGVCDVLDPPLIEVTSGHFARCFLYGDNGCVDNA